MKDFRKSWRYFALALAVIFSPVIVLLGIILLGYAAEQLTR